MDLYCNNQRDGCEQAREKVTRNNAVLTLRNDNEL